MMYIIYHQNTYCLNKFVANDLFISPGIENIILEMKDNAIHQIMIVVLHSFSLENMTSNIVNGDQLLVLWFVKSILKQVVLKAHQYIYPKPNPHAL